VSVTALLALAAPATGSLITNSLGEGASTFNATSTTTITSTSVGIFECTTVIMGDPITTRTSTTFRGHGTGEAKGTLPSTHTGHCGSSPGYAIEITNLIITDTHFIKHGTETTGTMTFSYTYDIRPQTGGSLIAECTFAGTLPVKKTGASTVNVEGEITKTAGSLFCPGSGTFKSDFTVTADGLGAATIH
jgi:hypothetical protein